MYFDFIDRMEVQQRAQEIVRFKGLTDMAPSSIGVWMARIFLYREYMWHLYDRATGAFILLNLFDNLQDGAVGVAISDPATLERDKARLEYYLGYIKFNRGLENAAIEHYDRALGYEVSDDIRDTALYAKSYALEAIYDYEGAFDKAVEGYWDYLREHARGRVPDYALYALARIYRRAEDLAGACYFYDALVEQHHKVSWPGRPARHRQKSAMMRAGLRQAIRTFPGIITAFSCAARLPSGNGLPLEGHKQTWIPWRLTQGRARKAPVCRDFVRPLPSTV